MEVSARTLPILLKQVAQRRRVTEVVFCPLLVDAMLTTHPLGFRLFFCSNGEEASMLTEAYGAESVTTLLPTRVRFSLAHELAHTLFYDLSEPRPRAAKFASEAQLDDLEKMCNRLARHLLMPSELLKKEISGLPKLKPETLLTTAARFGVSPEAFVVRLVYDPRLLMIHDFRGCIVVLMNTPKGFLVRAIARPRNINIPTELKTVRVGEYWQAGGAIVNDLLSKEQAGQTNLSLTLETSFAHEQKECVLEFARYGNSSEGQFYMVTVNMV